MGGRGEDGVLGDGFLGDAGEAVLRGLDGVLAPLVGGEGSGDLDELHGGLLVGDPGGGDGGLEADAALGIGGGFLEEGGVVGEAVVIVPHDADGGGADVEVGRGEELAEEGLVDGVHAPGDPEGLERRRS